ncbi:alkylation response protein AidB-like acyl-CoA dehydrogenase [Crossiella equi]|uniref:Alkylation response protein AidB-like acyl-CoA dehydrogenase n=1 Tax=Crossiella equi TaxID=130796 RepID=A0ABS5APA1_9PSEU|nr:acyl-CoA dehydrogenase family protein [Crossiella equi]MBP2478227.1 alkylation response protein AidB-like acyl-CoA dehydrogenase [Crossiella equi]
MDFRETDEQRALRASVAALAAKYGHGYWVEKAKAGEKTHELWREAGQLGYLGVAVPEEYGGGGQGITELAIVCEELAAGGCPLLLLVVSPAIAATVIAKSGTAEQKKNWLPGFADGSLKMSFAITEPDAGSNSHRIITTARADGDGWRLSGGKYYISGVDESDYTLVVARLEDARTGKLRPALFVVPTDAPGFTYQRIPMEITSPEHQFTLFFDDVKLPAEALVGGEDAGLAALFAGLNPERITVAAYGVGIGRYALAKASEYARTRKVWDSPIGSHQGIAHPLAKAHIEVELARLATQRAAWAYDQDDPSAAEAANIAKYSSAEAAIAAVDAAVQTHGGNGMSTEYGVGTLYGAARVGRIAPVSREMILNFVAQHTLDLGKSY